MILTVVFFLEMLLKILGLGITEYCKDSYNIFDFVIVMISIAEMAISFEMSMEIFLGTINDADRIAASELGGGKGASGLSALRSFRLFRIMKLARSWKSLRDLLATVST